MKKFKLIALTLLASTFGLTSCDVPDFVQKIPGVNKLFPSQGEKQEKQSEQAEVVSVKIESGVTVVTDETEPFKLVAKVEVKGGASKKVAWSSSDSSVATVSEEGLVTPLKGGKVTITAASEADSSKKDSVEIEITTVPGIASVTIQGGEETVLLYQGDMELSALVASKGSAAKGVKWESSDESIAVVEADGLDASVSFLAEGEVTISATSLFDNSKSDEITITVIDKGFAPELIEEGLTYSKEFPEEVIRGALGEGNYELYEPEGFWGGYYYAVNAPMVQLVFNSDDAYDYAYQVYSAGVSRVAQYETDEVEGYIFVDESDTYTCMAVNALDETGYAEGPAMLAFLPSEYCWYDSFGPTDDLAWSEEHFADDYDADVVELINAIPFTQMGYMYEIEYEYYSIFGYEFEYIYISDMTCSKETLADYGDTILAVEGASVSVDDYGDATYSVPIDYARQLDITFGFSQYGNMIVASVEDRVYDEFPAEPVASFIENSLRSNHAVPAYEGSNSGFTYSEGYDEDGPFSLVIINGATSEEEFFDYADALESVDYGFTVTTSPSSSTAYAKITASNERLQVLARFYDDYEMIYIWYYADLTVFEIPGLYVDAENVELSPGDSGQFEVTAYELGDNPEIVFSSSNDEVIEVQDNGEYLANQSGSATITATTSYNEQEYSVSFAVTVVSYTELFAAYVAEANEIFAGLGAEVELALPDGQATYFYEDYCGWSDYYSAYHIDFDSELTAEEYIDLLADEQYGYVVTVDGYGDPIAYNGTYSVGAYNYSDTEIYMTIMLDDYMPPQPGEGAVIDFSVDGLSGSGEGFEYSTAIGEGSSAPAVMDGELRLYDKNTFTISSEEAMTSITFEANNCDHNKAGANLLCDVGTIEETESGFVWTGSATEVTFTCERVGTGDPGKQCHITTVTIE